MPWSRNGASGVGPGPEPAAPSIKRGNDRGQRVVQRSIGLWGRLGRRQGINSGLQEVTDEFAVKVIHMVDKPGLDESRKLVANVEILRAP